MQDLITLFAQPSSWIAIATLAALEIVLGIDNLVFVAIVTSALPREDQPKARRFGLGLALVTRLLLLLTLAWILGLTKPLLGFHAFGHEVELTGKSFILLGGGLFLVYKATTEIYHKTELKGDHAVGPAAKKAAMGAILLNIAVMDVIFSLDSVITAVGMVGQIPLMVTAVLISMAVMIWFADPVSEFVNKHPSVKILALAFLLMIGVLLTAEAFEFKVPKGYVYFAMAFSLAVEMIELRYESNAARVARESGEDASGH